MNAYLNLCLKNDYPNSWTGIFRIAISTFALVQILVLYPNILEILGYNGYIQWLISERIFSTDTLPHIILLASVLKPYGISENQSVYLVTYFYLFSLIGLAIGYQTRLMAFFAFIAHLTLINTANLYAYGVESFTHLSLFYCIFIPKNTFFSLDKYYHHTAEDFEAGKILLFILRIHLCIVYCTTGIAKMGGDQWWNGEATWRALCQPQFAQFDLTFLAQIPWFSKILSWSTLLIETAYPLFIWYPKTRRYWLLATLGLHAGIGIFMGLRLFATIMSLLNLCVWGLDLLPIFNKKAVQEKS